VIEPPKIVQSDAVQTAAVHVTVARSRIQEVMGPGIQEVMAALAAQGIAPTGPWFTHHLRMDPAVFDFEICVPVARPVAPTDRVRPGLLPAARVVRTVYQGPYEGLGAAWGELKAWIAAQGLEEAPGLWERYLLDPSGSPDPASWRTELDQPLAG
jgi:effector-binding domain-containing protein